MSVVHTYTVLTVGDCKLHQLHLPEGKHFVMGEVASGLFGATPTSFLQELRTGRYNKIYSKAPDVLQTVNQLHLPVESTANTSGVVLLPVATLERLLQDQRRFDLVQPFKLAQLKIASQESAQLMAAGDYEAALPIALEALQQGEALFKPAPALQLFPLYLLAAQANLGLRRTKPCEECLALAQLLLIREPEAASHLMHSQLARLYGQLYAYQGKLKEALTSFAEDVYHCSCQYGPRDWHTSLGYYNLSKVLVETGNTAGALSCSSLVVDIWTEALLQLVLNLAPTAAAAAVAAKGGSGSAADGGAGMGDQRHAAGAAVAEAAGGGVNEAAAAEGAVAIRPGDVGRLQMTEVADMLQEVAKAHTAALGATHQQVGATHFAASMAYTQLGDSRAAVHHWEAARTGLPAMHVLRPLLDKARSRAAAAAAPPTGPMVVGLQ